jgi:hypothetical protein
MLGMMKGSLSTWEKKAKEDGVEVVLHEAG